MDARVEKGRIRISFPDDMEPGPLADLQQRIMSLIGSATVVADHEREMSCALGIPNFRKLKELGCKLRDDIHTREVVAKLRRDLDTYLEETRRGNAAKARTLRASDSYTFKKPPLAKHQVVGFDYLCAMDEPGLLGDVGCGKTFMVVCFADHMIKTGKQMAFLVVCPVNLIDHVWLTDVEQFTDLTAVGLREEATVNILASDYDEKGDNLDDRIARARVRDLRRLDPVAKKRARLRATKRFNKLLDARFAQIADLYVVNSEQLRNDAKEKRILALCKRLRAEGKTIVLIIDESSKIKTRTSRTYRSLKKLRMLCERCIIMTGSPSPNGLSDLWAQFHVLDAGMTLQPNFVDFRHDTCREVQLRGITWKDKRGQTHNATKWMDKPGMAMQIHRMLEQRVIRFRTQDCIDLPPKRFITREIAMNAEQIAMYEAMENMLFAEVGDEGETVTAKVAAVKMMKLREITGGFVRTDGGVDKPLGISPKMLELDDLLEQSIADKLGDSGPPNKALIWAQYQWECHELVKRYSKTYGARGLFGGISSAAKNESLRRFKSDASCRLLVCHPASVGHGLNLTDANFIFYYSLSHNFDEFYQSHGRTARPGQKKIMTYYFLVCYGTIDEELIDAIRSKKNLSDIITDGRISREQIFERRKRRPPQTVIWNLPDVSAAAGEQQAEGSDLHDDLGGAQDSF
jgi:SNF2 family DNA or RNA helicase